MNKKRFFVDPIAFLAVFGGASNAMAITYIWALMHPVPPAVFQGRLTDQAGNTLSDGNSDVTVRIYDDSLGGSLLWEESQTVWHEDGLFNMELGAQNPIKLDSLWGNDSLSIVRWGDKWLEISVGLDPPMQPRTRFGSVPFSIVAQRMRGDIMTSWGELVLGDTTRDYSGVAFTTDGGVTSAYLGRDPTYYGDQYGGIRLLTDEAQGMSLLDIAAKGGMSNGQSSFQYGGIGDSSWLKIIGIPDVGFDTTWIEFQSGHDRPAMVVRAPGNSYGGVYPFEEVVALFKQPRAPNHSAISISSAVGQDAIVYLSMNDTAYWDLRHDASHRNQFQIRHQKNGINWPVLTIDTTGYVGIGTDVQDNPLEMASGARVTVGGVWTNASDSSLKENYEELNAQDILSKIASLNIQEWNYKTEEDRVRHIGPTAQEFNSAFGLGDSTSIATTDPSGVALIAIQELHRENQELKAKIRRLELLLEQSIEQQGHR